MTLTADERLRLMHRERNRRYRERKREWIRARQTARNRRLGIRPLSEYLEERRRDAKGRQQTSRESARRYRQRHPDRKKASNARRIRFLDKSPLMPTNPRKGVCTKCGKQWRPGERQFQMHHLRYDSQNPLAHTVEVCYGCHVAIHGIGRKKAGHAAA